MNAKDAGVVEGMCAAGMSLEALYKIFKNFDKNLLFSLNSSPL